MTVSRRHAMLVPFAAACAASASHAPATGSARAACTPASPNAPRTPVEDVPSFVGARITALAGGGAIVAFAQERVAGVSVVAVDGAGCVRWRASLPGGWPIVAPVQPSTNSIVVASSTQHLADGGLRISTLSATTGRVGRSDDFPALEASAGGTTLLTTGRGDVAAVLAARKVRDGGGRRQPATLVLTRPGLRAGWRRQILTRANTFAPAAAIRLDGTMVVGYPRRQRLLVRTGTIAAGLGQPADAGPIGRSFRSAAVAIGAGGTTVAGWQSTRHSLPWRLRAAVRPGARGRFAPDVRLAEAPGVPNTLFTGRPPALAVDARGRVTVGFAGPTSPISGRDRLLCATGTRDGRFAPARAVAGVRLGTVDDIAPLLHGPSGAVALSRTDAGSGASVVAVDPSCRARGSRRVDGGAGYVVAAAIDARDRVWVLGLAANGRGSGALRLTIMPRIG